mgnify:CR=1 FL=1
MSSRENTKDDYDFEKDEVIKRYFKRIYTILDESIRNKLLQLEISTEELKQILKYIGFLPKEKQEKYLKELMEHGNKEE